MCTGLHPEEAVSYLSDALFDLTETDSPVYAICGTGHHSKDGRDKVGKAIRSFLDSWRYAFREFSVPGDRNNSGGIIGIDPSSFDHDLADSPHAGFTYKAEAGSDIAVRRPENTKIRILKADR